jgi:hypothetical protein
MVRYVASLICVPVTWAIRIRQQTGLVVSVINRLKCSSCLEHVTK